MPAVLIALNTGMRYSELRLLRGAQADLKKQTVRVGKSKTEAGSGRKIPLNDRATQVFQCWADRFPKRKPEHFVFTSERYGAGGNEFEPCVYDHDPKRPIVSWKEAWESAKDSADVEVRFHDLRHTCVTRMLEGGAPLSVVAAILGWKTSSGRTTRRSTEEAEEGKRSSEEEDQSVSTSGVDHGFIQVH